MTSTFLFCLPGLVGACVTRFLEAHDCWLCFLPYPTALCLVHYFLVARPVRVHVRSRQDWARTLSAQNVLHRLAWQILFCLADARDVLHDVHAVIFFVTLE